MYAFISVVAVRMKKTSTQTTTKATNRNAGPILARAAPVLTNNPVPRARCRQKVPQVRTCIFSRVTHGPLVEVTCAWTSRTDRSSYRQHLGLSRLDPAMRASSRRPRAAGPAVRKLVRGAVRDGLRPLFTFGYGGLEPAGLVRAERPSFHCFFLFPFHPCRPSSTGLLEKLELGPRCCTGTTRSWLLR